MWFLPYPDAWSGLWRLCRNDFDQVKVPVSKRAPRGQPERLSLGSIGRTTTLYDALYLPTVTQLLLDDVCLQAALVNHAARKAHWWQHRAMDAWHKEAAVLEVERHRLTVEAARLGSRLRTSTTDQRRSNTEPTD